MPLRLKKKTVREIAGSRIDFQHPNSQEAEYWNETIRGFSAADWEEKVSEMSGLGMDTIVVGAVILEGKAFYPSAVVPETWELGCDDPLEAVLRAADRLGIEVFVGVGYFSDEKTALEEGGVERPWCEEIPRELDRRYGDHRSFHGWYLPRETAIDGYFSDEYIAYVKEMAGHCRAAGARRPILIAPSGIRTAAGDARFIGQLKELGADHIAYRDDVGVRASEPADLGEIFARVARAHEQADRPLWANLEIFAYEGPTGKSALIPAPFRRVKTQIETISPHVRKLLSLPFLGMMNPGSSKCFAGHTSSANLHYDYHEWRCQQAES